MDVKESLPDVTAKINSLLPDDIRLYGVSRGTKRFNCKAKVK